MQREGYECATAPNGVAAAHLLGQSQFDCLISDIRMLGNCDLELIRGIGQIQPGLPVILVTGYPSVETATASFQLPVVTYLVKPIDFPALLAAVREATLRRSLLRQFDSTRTRLQQWLSDVGQLAEGLQGAPRGDVAGPMDVYLMVTYRNIVDALSGLKAVMECSLSIQPETTGRALRSTSPLLLIEALRDAIDVLERTKDAFRSRELGDLRRRLEGFLTVAR